MKRRSRSHRRTRRTLAATLACAVAASLTVYAFQSTGPKSAGAQTTFAQPSPATPASRPAQSPASVATTPPPAVAPSTRPAGPAATQPVEITASTHAAVAEGKSLIDKGQWLAARKVLNDALLTGQLPAEDAAKAKQLLSEVSRTVFFSLRRFPDDPFQEAVTVEPGARLAKIAYDRNVPWDLIARINRLSDPKKLQAGRTLKVLKGPFNAVVTKTAFTLDVWLGTPEQPGSLFVTSYPVGLGQDDSTPTGTWLCEASRKIKNPTYFSPRGEGIVEADDPKNPLGEYWIGLTGTEGHAVGKMSYGIHGTIDPESVGHMSSLGCIRLRNEDVEQLFSMLEDGKSTVIVRN